jgi:hypothetical protein
MRKMENKLVLVGVLAAVMLVAVGATTVFHTTAIQQAKAQTCIGPGSCININPPPWPKCWPSDPDCND